MSESQGLVIPAPGVQVRFIILNQPIGYSCCYTHTIIDTLNNSDDWLCETASLQEATMIVNALNAYYAPETGNTSP